MGSRLGEWKTLSADFLLSLCPRPGRAHLASKSHKASEGFVVLGALLPRGRQHPCIRPALLSRLTLAPLGAEISNSTIPGPTWCPTDFASPLLSPKTELLGDPPWPNTLGH